MKKFRLRKFKLGVVTFSILLYFEIIFRILTDGIIFSKSLIYILLFNIIVSLFIDILINNKVVYLLILFLLGFMYGLDLCVYKMFGFFFDFSMLNTTDQVSKFMGDTFNLIISNFGGLFLLMGPFIVLSIFNYLIKVDKGSKKKVIIKCSLLVVSVCSFFLYLGLDKEASKLYYDVNNVSLNTREFGVVNTFLIDTYRTLFGFSESFEIIEEEIIENENSEYSYNNLEIDFDSLINNEENEEVKRMHEYFKNETGTLKNEYTNYFTGKNLILFMAESFNEIGVSKKYTPTLYKLVHEGFSFNNFYTPTILSTIGGEFQELTGLVASSSALGPWKSGTNTYPMGIAKMFKEMGYKTYAYHDHNVYFQNRYIYLERLGFDNFKGCNNGLEKLINCNAWPESDVEMIKATVNDFAQEEPFMVYYVTVSGHGGYTFSGNKVAQKNKELVSDLVASEGAKAYVATQIELDRALEELINMLEEKDVLKDTVIALVGDHYPYFLSIDEVNELSDFKRDSVVGVNKSNFILWNSEIDKISIDKTGSEIDVLPTIYNLFGANYDSRLIMGKDILSTTEGLAIFDNRSWLTDKGIYYAKSKKFVGDASEEYVSYINKIVDNRIAMSKNIIKYDYYKKVLGE